MTRIEVGDCIEVMAGMPAHSVDAIVTDPPYGIGFMGHEWDQPSIAHRAGPGAWDQPPAPGRTAPRSRGAMEAGKYDMRPSALRDFQAWTTAWATEALRVLKPGGHVLSFASPRTNHRHVCGLEDAGFEIRDTLMWLFGSGFPKSLNLDGEHAGRGTALKPAYEPITLARKPLAGTVRATVEAHGTGALNIDATRIEGPKAGGSGAPPLQFGGLNARPFHEHAAPRGDDFDTTNGRLAAATALDEQTGELRSGANPTRRVADKFRNAYGDFVGQEECTPARGADAGGASRFFYVAKPDQDERHAGLGDGAGLFSPPDVPELNDHPTIKPIDLMRWLCRLVTPPGGVVLDPFAGSGTTGCAAVLDGFTFIGIERKAAYASIARARLAHWSSGASNAA